MQCEELSCHADAGCPWSMPRRRAAYCVAPTGAHERKRCRRPRSPPGQHVPAPDASPNDDDAQALDGLASAVDRARRMVPEGTFAVGAGLAISGVTTYGFQILAFRGLSKPDYAALNALWVFVFVLAPGVFLPLEQEVGHARRRRASCAASAAGRSCAAPVCSAARSRSCSRRRSSCSRRTTADRAQQVQRSRRAWSCASIVALFTFGIEYLARGAFAGVGPLRRVRREPRRPKASSACCRASRSRSPTSPTRSGTGCASRFRRCSRPASRCTGRQGLTQPGPDAPWSELSSNLGYLLGGSLLAQVLSYAPFLGAQVLAKPDSSAPRSPTSSSASSCRASRSCCSRRCRPRCCPKLSTLVSAGRDDEFQNGVRKLVLIVVGIGVLGVVVGGLDRAVRGPDPVRPQVQPRQRRRRVARGRQRPVHPGAHAVAGADRAARVTGRRWSRGSSAWSRSSRVDRWSRTDARSCGSSSARSPAPA